jgi:hypothetical protein
MFLHAKIRVLDQCEIWKEGILFLNNCLIRTKELKGLHRGGLNNWTTKLNYITWIIT